MQDTFEPSLILVTQYLRRAKEYERRRLFARSRNLATAEASNLQSLGRLCARAAERLALLRIGERDAASDHCLCRLSHGPPSRAWVRHSRTNVPIVHDDMFADPLAKLDEIEAEPLGKGVAILRSNLARCDSSACQERLH